MIRVFFTKRDQTLPNQRLNRVVIAAGLVSLAFYIMLQILTPERALPYASQMIDASRIMAEAISVIRTHCDQSGIKIDEAIDPNRTGLVGPKNSALATTLGNLEAKRTTTNPNMAGLVVQLLNEAGVEAGDTIAVGASASFPALLIATLAAAEAMQIHPVVIVSLGASSYGGTNPDFDLLDAYKLLIDKGIFAISPAAISLGGEADVGKDFPASLRERLVEEIQTSGIPFIREPDLERNVVARMQIYASNSARVKTSAFINIGGNYANLGTSELALDLKPGLNEEISLPAKSERGVLFEMADRGIPCIHFLFIKGLVLKYGMPWDPIPLPEAGEP